MAQPDVNTIGNFFTFDSSRESAVEDSVEAGAEASSDPTPSIVMEAVSVAVTQDPPVVPNLEEPPTSAAPIDPKWIEEPEVDVESFGEDWQQWLLTRNNKRRSFIRSPINLKNVDRDDVIGPLFQAVDKVIVVDQAKMLFRPYYMIINGEDLLDAGGGTREVLTLFYEQLEGKVVKVPKRGLKGTRNRRRVDTPVTEWRLFEQGRGSSMCLPTAVDDDLLKDMQESQEHSSVYFKIGRIFQKTVIEDCFIPTRFVPDLLVHYFLMDDYNHHHHHHQQKDVGMAMVEQMDIPMVVKILKDLGLGYIRHWILLPCGPFCGSNITVGNLLQDNCDAIDQDTLVGPSNWEDVMRRLLAIQLKEVCCCCCCCCCSSSSSSSSSR